MDKIYSLNIPKAPNDYIFISYAHRDFKRVVRLLNRLRRYYRIWWDKELQFGERWNDKLLCQIENSHRLLFFSSKHSLNSKYCHDELEHARKNNIEIDIIQIDSTDFSGLLEEEFTRNQSIKASDFKKEDRTDNIIKALRETNVYSKCALNDEQSMTPLSIKERIYTFFHETEFFGKRIIIPIISIVLLAISVLLHTSSLQSLTTEMMGNLLSSVGIAGILFYIYSLFRINDVESSLSSIISLTLQALTILVAHNVNFSWVKILLLLVSMLLIVAPLSSQSKKRIIIESVLLGLSIVFSIVSMFTMDYVTELFSYYLLTGLTIGCLVAFYIKNEKIL